MDAFGTLDCLLLIVCAFHKDQKCDECHTGSDVSLVFGTCQHDLYILSSGSILYCMKIPQLFYRVKHRR